MIPDFDALESLAARTLESVPQALTQSRLRTGLYGLGFLGRWALPRLMERGINMVACYDADAALHGTSVNGLPVHSASDIGLARPDFMFITARHAVKPVSATLSDAGVRHVSYDAWHVASEFAAFRHVHDCILQDARSREVLRAVLMAMLTGDKSSCAKVCEKDQYFCLPQFHGSEREIYVDAGAFVGDSTERFIWAHNGMFSHIYAFEPGPRQFAALEARVRRLTVEWALDSAIITLVNGGLGASNGTSSAKSDSGQLTSLAIREDGAAAGVPVSIFALDDFLDGRRITFLKADVEGMEMALLKGAAATIRLHKPKIAICVYHYPSDLTEIAGYLAGLVPSYRFALRHHSPQLLETVLYCWAE